MSHLRDNMKVLLDIIGRNEKEQEVLWKKAQELHTRKDELWTKILLDEMVLADMKFELSENSGRIILSHSGFTTAEHDKAIELVTPWATDYHGGLNIEPDVQLRCDDGDISIVLEGKASLAEFAKKWGIKVSVGQLEADRDSLEAKLSLVNESIRLAKGNQA